ncbi:putative reverse transcriptase domain-containing protein [Tanacetum coccineum]|uniref:Reverse transcriptase domain-containing protein n=1 Tax=Tanacetum coccineum TaxID=301880 RepID=A0ABQ5CZF6_9ASTR
MVELRNDGALYYLDRIWVPLKGDVRTLIIDEAHKSKYYVHPRENKMYYDLRDRYWWPGMKKDIVVYVLAVNARGIRNPVRHEYDLPPSDRRSEKCRSLIMWAEVGEGHLIGLELVQETTEKISQIKDRLKAARDCQKSYADKKRKPLEFSVGFVGPFEIVEKVGPVAYRLDFPEELDGVHDTFHPMEILEREFKKLKRSRIAIVKVWWNLKRSPEFTWDREDQMKLKYPHLFSADK